MKDKIRLWYCLTASSGWTWLKYRKARIKVLHRIAHHIAMFNKKTKIFENSLPNDKKKSLFQLLSTFCWTLLLIKRDVSRRSYEYYDISTGSSNVD